MEHIDLGAPRPLDPEDARSGGPPEFEARPQSGWADFQRTRMRFLADRSRDSAGLPPLEPPGDGGDARRPWLST